MKGEKKAPDRRRYAAVKLQAATHGLRSGASLRVFTGRQFLLLRKALAVSLSALLVMSSTPLQWALAAEYEITAASFTVDNQINLSSVTYFQQKTTLPGNPASATQLTAPGGLYFDGTRYRVWDIPTSSWVSLTTGTAGGLLPWSELTGFPPACPGGQFASAVGGTLTCATPSGTLSGGTANYYGRWTGATTMGVGNLTDGSANVTVINNSSLTVTGNAFSVGVSTLVATNGTVGVGNTSPSYLFQVGTANMLNVDVANGVGLGIAPSAGNSLTIGGSANVGLGGSGAYNFNGTGNVTFSNTGANGTTIQGLKFTTVSGGTLTLTDAAGNVMARFK